MLFRIFVVSDNKRTTILKRMANITELMMFHRIEIDQFTDLLVSFRHKSQSFHRLKTIRERYIKILVFFFFVFFIEAFRFPFLRSEPTIHHHVRLEKNQSFISGPRHRFWIEIIILSMFFVVVIVDVLVEIFCKIVVRRWKIFFSIIFKSNFRFIYVPIDCKWIFFLSPSRNLCFLGPKKRLF